MGVWNSSKQTEHDIIPVFLLLSLLTEQLQEIMKKNKSPHLSTTQTRHRDCLGIITENSRTF